MAHDWPLVPLGDLVDPTRGISYGIVQPGEHVEDGVPIIRAGDLRGDRIDAGSPLRVSASIEANYSRTRLRGGELVMSIVGTVGQTAVINEQFIGWNTARAVAVIPVRPDIGAYWVRIALKTPAARERINSRLNTTVQATLNLKDVAELPIALPPLAEREAISSVLGALDEKIELNRRMNETLEVTTRAIFKDWFVDFGPTRAKIEGHPPYLASDIWSLFPDRLDEAGTPAGWKSGTLGDLAEQVGESVKPEALSPETPYIGLEHMPRRSIALTDWGGAGKVTSGKLAFKRGDFLFGKLRPYFHKVGIAPLDGICSTDIVVMNATQEAARAFVIACISQDEFVAFTDRTSDGTKMPRTSWGRMERYVLCVPDVPVLHAFNAIVQPMLNRIIANIHESRSLTVTRNLLLPKLMSGETRVRDPEENAGGAI